MKYLKLFENFNDDDYVLIFSYLEDSDVVKVDITGDMSDFNTTLINIEPKKKEDCPNCDNGKIVDVFYDDNGDRYKDDVDCPICNGEAELEYFHWDAIRDVINNFSNYVNKDYYVDTYSIYSDNIALPMSEFLKEIESNTNAQNIKEFCIIINDSEDDY